jgi:hypothetical protein
MNDNLLHLALGDSAGGVLRAACAEHGLPGWVHVIPDDLSHGPLHDGRVRLQYMRGSFVGYGAWRTEVSDAFACWDDLDARLATAATASSAVVEVAVWAGDNASEAVLLAMACDRLAGLRHDRLAHVGVPTQRNHCYVAQFAPAALVPLFAGRRRLQAKERAAQAALFRRLRDASRAETGQLRRWQRGELVPVPADRLDPLLLRACTSEWRPAAGVIGSAMASCERHNLASDLFLTARLQRLIDRGRIKALGPRKELQDYWVRLMD